MEAADRLRPFVAEFVVDWLRHAPDQRHRMADGTLVFVDISGFTRLTERLAGKGKIGAEEMSDLLDVTFAALLAVAYDYGAWLVKWGGDAVLLLFEGPGNAERACTAAHEMRRTMRRVGRLRTSIGAVSLRMSIGLHTGRFDFYLVGSLHRELLITGPSATETVAMETAAAAGEIVISVATASALRPRFVGAPKDAGFLLGRSPGSAPQPQAPSAGPTASELEACLPEATREHLLAGGTDGEHRLVAVAFVEFSGAGEVLQSSGTSAMADAIDHVIRTCQESAQRHQVTFWETDVGRDGGKVMLVSGAPRSAGQDEDRILAVVRDVIDAGGPLQLRAGVNRGRVYFGEFGPPFRRTYSVKGDAVNLAARLMAKAGPGEIYAAQDVLVHARTRFETEALPPITVKGKARPVVAQRVGAAVGAEADKPRVDLAFTGREEETSRLLASLVRARDGKGMVWQICGPAGIGKSRLVAELITRADAVTVLTATCDQYHSASPYAPFRRLLRKLAGIAGDASPASAGRALGDVVSRAAPSLASWIPLLATIVGAEVPSTPEVDALESKFRKAYQEERAILLLAALVPGPLLLVIEDAHLLDDASVDLLRRLAQQAADRPWLVVATTQSQPDADAVFEPDVAETMELRALPADVVDAVVKLATEDRPLAPHEMAMLTARSGGNPLFVQELLGATRDGGTVSALPDSIEGVIAVQIDRLGSSERRALRIASVLGSRIDVAVLEKMLREEGVDVGETASLFADFLDRDRDGLRFRHTLARDAAYEGLSFRRRQSLHGLAGDVIERFAGDRTDDVANLLSLHFLHARRFADAWRYARIAGDQARDIHAQTEAAELYERALDAAGRIETDLGSDVAAVAEALGDARYKLGQFAGAASAYRSARSVTRADVDRARLCYKCSLVAERVGQLGTALRWLTKARAFLVAATGDEADRLRAECSAQYGLIRHWQGRDVEAIACLSEAVAMAERTTADDALATALVWLDNCEMTLGGSGDGEHARRALATWRRLGNRPWEEARVLNQLGIRAYFAGQWDVAVDFYRQSKEACERAGDQFTAAVESGNMAEVLADQGRLDEAEPLMRDAQRVWRAAGAPSFVAFGKSQLGRLAARAGRFDEALELLRSARVDYVRDGEHAEVLETDARLAECLLLQGNASLALDAANAGLARAPSAAGVLPQVPLLQRVRGVALAQLGRYDDAFAALDASLSAAEERRARHEVAWTLAAFVAARRAVGQPADDALTGRRAELFSQLGIVTVAEPGTPT